METARAQLIEHNLRLVAHIVKKYYAASAEQDDLISIGTIGLIKAVGTFRPDKNIRLATYASKCIQNELLMHFRQKRKTAGELSLSDALETDGDGNALALQDVLSCEDEGLLRSRSTTATTPCTARWPPCSPRASARSSACATGWACPRRCPSVRSPGRWGFRAVMYQSAANVNEARKALWNKALRASLCNRG